MTLGQTLKQAVKRDSQKIAVEVIDMGRLSDIVWPGSVSLDTMIQNRFTTQTKVDDAVSTVNNYYVSVNPKAKTRCIDGRQDPNMDEDNLGPQVPGGAPGAALAYRLGVDKDDLTRGTFLSDAEFMISQFTRLGFAPGGHRDQRNANDSGITVGCGAIDGMDKILAAMTDRNLVDDHKRVVKTLLGPWFDRDNYLRVMGAAVVVNGRSEEYFRGREAIIDTLEQKSPNSVSVLQGDHQECLWIVNMVPNTTLASNRFAIDFGGMQAFGYDLWRSMQMAQRILPLPTQELDRQRYVMARVMSTVATLMALTDGSQRFIIRTQKTL